MLKDALKDDDSYDAESGFEDCDLFSCDDESEELNDTDPDEAVEAHLDRRVEALESPPIASVTVYGYKRKKLDGPNEDLLLEDVLERLDEEFGSPHEATEPTPAMVEAAEAFCSVIRAEYHVWQCEQVAKARVDVAKWVRRHRPDWLPE